MEPEGHGADPLRRRGLAKGLSALLGDAAPGQAQAGIRALPIESLSPSTLQPRRMFDADELDELARSIAAQGILQPILVRPAREAGRYEIIAGERRWRAAQQARLHDVPVLVRELGDADVLGVALIENLQRADLNPLEEAAGYDRLAKEFGQTQEAIADLVGKSRSHVANSLRLLGLPDEVKAAVDAGKLSAGHARALLTAADPAALAREVMRGELNVRQTERLAKRGSARKRAEPAEDPNARMLERELAETLGLAVAIRHTPKHGGALTIKYQTLDQLHDVIRRLKGNPGPRIRSL
ncbi:MAG: ParB/RepB/Spo0J family partition protein [Alphaproteobacteria bacterium]